MLHLSSVQFYCFLTENFLFQADGVDMHPEKRVKAAWNAFEQGRISQLRAENPSLRLSQIRQMLRKEWQKSPLNPLNQ